MTFTPIQSVCLRRRSNGTAQTKYKTGAEKHLIKKPYEEFSFNRNYQLFAGHVEIRSLQNSSSGY